MSYRDDLYRASQIIGYTGQLHAAPSVYFYWPERQAYGHITQAHGKARNVGRHRYNADAGYLIENAPVNELNYPVGELAEHDGLPATDTVCVEWRTEGGQVVSFHTSRNLFVPVCGSVFFPNGATDIDAIAILAQSIRNFPDVKPMYA